MSDDPMITPSRVMSDPAAWRGNTTLAIAVTAAGYTSPVSTVMTVIKRKAGSRSENMTASREMEQHQQLVDGPDARERRDDATESVDEQVAREERRGFLRAVLHASQRQGHERDDDQRVEDDRGENRALRR